MALDVGDKRVGVAVCDELQTLASPLLCWSVAPEPRIWQRLAPAGRGAARWLAWSLAIRSTPTAARARRPSRPRATPLRVASGLALPLLLWDEYGSSQEAAARLAHAPAPPPPGAAGRRSRGGDPAGLSRQRAGRLVGAGSDRTGVGQSRLERTVT